MQTVSQLFIRAIRAIALGAFIFSVAAMLAAMASIFTSHGVVGVSLMSTVLSMFAVALTGSLASFADDNTL